MGAQSLWLLVIARKLGATGYGTFAGIAGLATFLGAFSGLGLGLLLLRAVARDHSRLGAYWHKGLRWTIVSGALIAIFFVATASFTMGAQTDIVALVAIGIAETLLFPIVSFCAFAFNAFERAGYAAALPALAATSRLLGAVVFFIVPLAATLTTYSLIHLVATLLAAWATIVVTRANLSPPRERESLTRAEFVDGMGYSSVWAVTNALTSLDKTLVLHLSSGTVAGLYASAYRLTMIFTLPVDALAMSALPRVFRHDKDSRSGRRLITTMFAASLLFSSVAAAALYFAANIIPWLLGPSFDDAVQAARMLVWLMPAYALRMLGGNILLGLDGQWLRLAIESCGIGMLCLFAWLFVPHYGLVGATRMIVCTEACLTLLTWTFIAWRLRRDMHPSP
ncbi:oligosaccharide flippase family protein [Luteibacter sp. CQ10]